MMIYISNPHHKKIKDRIMILDPVKIRNKFAVVSTFQEDPIFPLKKPVFCSGLVKEVNQNAYNFKINELVGYISYENALEFEESSQLIFKLPKNNSFQLISILPYVSYALKILRIVNPKIGQKIVIFGLNNFSLLLLNLLKLSGALVYIILLENNKIKLKYNEDVNVIKNIQDVINRFKDEKLDFCISNSKINKDNNESLKCINFNSMINLDEISIFDVGLDDPNYRNGIKYPYSYIRWDFRKNIEYFFYLIENSIINLIFLEIQKLTINTLEEITEKVSQINQDSLILFEILK